MSEAGRLYAFGPSDGGRLGFPAVVGAGGVSAPRILRAPCLAEEKVVAAAGGQMHSSCVCASGKVGRGCGYVGGLSSVLEKRVRVCVCACARVCLRVCVCAANLIIA